MWLVVVFIVLGDVAVVTFAVMMSRHGFDASGGKQADDAERQEQGDGGGFVTSPADDQRDGREADRHQREDPLHFRAKQRAEAESAQHSREQRACGAVSGAQAACDGSDSIYPFAF